MASQTHEIAFLGLGAMGFGMATHLVKQGYSVTGFDIWEPTTEKFKAVGGNATTSPAAAATGKSYCVVMVATAHWQIAGFGIVWHRREFIAVPQL